MRIIAGAQANGFGPVSKLVTVSRLFPEAQKIFIGDGTALEFARRHSSTFDQIIACEPESLSELQPLLLESDFGLVLMHHELAFWLAVLRRPFYFFDSLFGFWIIRSQIPELMEAVRKIPDLERSAAYDLFHSFSVHEQKIISHLLARLSFVQNFAGVPQRIDSMARYGINHTRLIGPIVDLEAASLGMNDEGSDTKIADQASFKMLINLCGVKNYILDYHQNDYYINILERWARDFLHDHPECQEILLCCGRYTEPGVELIGESRLRRQCLSHDKFITAVREADVFLCSPGLTSISETVHLNRLPILLPEQHYSQFYNLESLRGTALGALSLSNSDLFDDYVVPVHDYNGSLKIIEYTKRLHDSESLYEKFHLLLNERVELTRQLTAEKKHEILGEVRQLFAGSDLRDSLQELLADFRQYQAET